MHTFEVQIILSSVSVTVNQRGGAPASLAHVLWFYVIWSMKETHKGIDDSTRQEGFLEDMMFEWMFIKALEVLTEESLFQAEGPACAIRWPLEDCRRENYWRGNGYWWLREQKRGTENGKRRGRALMWGFLRYAKNRTISIPEGCRNLSTDFKQVIWHSSTLKKQ